MKKEKHTKMNVLPAYICAFAQRDFFFLNRKQIYTQRVINVNVKLAPNGQMNCER